MQPQQQQQQQQQQQHIILFYRYHPLTSDAALIEDYRRALYDLCAQLELSGRILVGASETEGINGTLAGKKIVQVRAFTWALMKDKTSLTALCDGDINVDKDDASVIRQAIETFWHKSAAFFTAIRQEELRITSPSDFKWSRNHYQGDDNLFPDLRVVVRKELIGAGGSMADISLEETAQGYLTPSEWHERLSKATNSTTGVQLDDTVIIDCRNTKEFEIGRFQGALDPQTTTFSQFPAWVQHNKALLANKQVLMYCTGGIRCEKASAYIRRTVPQVAQVNHLKGGIHKYLETFGGREDCLWHGKNFVFDGRQAVSAEETHLGKDGATNGITIPTSQSDCQSPEIVGKCVYCDAPYDQFDAKCVCAVCREPLLACRECQASHREFHCRQHFHLRTCYFVNLESFNVQELRRQEDLLETFLIEIAVGRKFKQKRKTLTKQYQRIANRLQELSDAKSDSLSSATSTVCRNCGQADCTGYCWGFFGLKRKEILEANKKDTAPRERSIPAEWSELLQRKPKRQRQKDKEHPEIGQLGLFHPCSSFRDPETGIRVLPCTTRLLKCHAKGKWCGRPVIDVVQEQFKELARPDRLQESLRHGLLRLNGIPLETSTVAQVKLKSSDLLSRIVHWHEAPVIVPKTLDVEKVTLPDSVVHAYGLETTCACIYVCNKPSSVPVHPAGPYFANTLSFLAEAQLGLEPQSLHPVHRTDRVTSGLTLCCTNPKVARIFHTSLSTGTVRKMYIAKVKGKFPASQNELDCSKQGATWLEKSKAVEIDAPIYTSDPANGIREISDKGKESRSRFKLISYDSSSDTSIILCFPLTGRNHQLRVHVASLDFPILGDVQYGGTVAATRDLDKSDKAIQSMHQAMETDNRAHDAAVKKACPMCNNKETGIENSFTSAQLLKEGHAVMLHAFRYHVTFVKQCEEIGSAEYSVGLPDWVSSTWKDRLVWLDE